MPFHTHILANGLEIIGETLPSSRSVSVGFFVNTGARDETGPESGVSHFLEHMVFKGTPHRTALEVNLHFDRIGASYNAYTSEESTVYYASMLPEYLTTAVDILADILRPSLREEDFTTEKQVILEEIGMYEDMPSFAASDHARRIYFEQHPLGQSILGTKESVGALTATQMKTYFDRRYTAPNIIASVAGNFDWPAFVKLLEAKCGDWPSTKAPRNNLVAAKGAGGTHVIPKEGVVQQHMMVISPGPSAEDASRYAAATLGLAIGDETGSRFYWELVHPGHVESASCGIDQNMANGVVASSFSCEPESTAENLATLNAVLAEVQKNNITAEELATAKSKIVSRLVRHSERPSGRMRAIASSWIYNREYHDIDVELNRFDAVTLESIREVMDRFPLTNTTAVTYGPATSV
ncbi:pitrilysin family protein [soil metagenome]